MTIAPRRNIRFARNEYVGRRIYFITVCSENRCVIFQNPNRARAAIESLKRVSKSMNVLVHAFCVMPDHVHILAEGVSDTSDVVKFVAQWKQSTGYLFRHELPRRFWQRRFYDHVLRHAEDSDAVAWYIWMNPVRKGLVAQPQLYPLWLLHCGMAKDKARKRSLGSAVESSGRVHRKLENRDALKRAPTTP